MILNLRKLNSSTSKVISKTCKLYYSLTSSLLVKNLSTNSHVELKINEIPNNSTILIGGYLTQSIPKQLVSMLSASKCNNLTLITNASVPNNTEFRQMFKTRGKIKRLITSLDNNRLIFHDKDLMHDFDLNLMKNLDFIQNYCINTKRNGQYALVKSDFVDKDFNLYWSNSNTYFNENFARSAQFYSIAESDLLFIDETEPKFESKCDSLFVEAVLVSNHFDRDSCSTDQKKHFNANSDDKHFLKSMNDLENDLILKRLLIEFNHNNMNIYISNELKHQIESFYMPRHLNLNIMNQNIESWWPSKLDWLNYSSKLDLCVCDVKTLNQNGEILLDNSSRNDCLEIDLINSLNEQTKLIAIMKFNKNTTTNIHNLNLVSVKRKPDMIISDRGVFKLNRNANRFELIEYKGDSNLKAINNDMPFQTYVNENNVKLMSKQCF